MATESSSPKKRPDAERIAALEESQDRVREDIHSLTKVVGDLAREFRSSMSTLVERLSIQQKTPWSALASWAAVIVAVIALGGSGYVRDMSRQEGHIERMRLDWAPRSQVELGLKQLDDSLQREMRLLSAIQQERIRALEREVFKEDNH